MQAPLDLTPLKAKSVSFDWEYMFTKTDFDYEIASQGAILKKIARLADTNQIHSITTQVYQAYRLKTSTQSPTSYQVVIQLENKLLFIKPTQKVPVAES